MNILITSVGRRNYIVEYFKSALQGNGNVIVTNSIKDTAGMYAGDKAFVSPPIISSEYIPFLLDVCKNENIKAIVPLFDMDLSAISLSKDVFLKNGVIPIVSDYFTISRCFDKLKYPQLLRKINVCTPRTFSKLDQALNMIRTGKLNFPIILKPRWGTGSVSTVAVYDEKELAFEFQRLTAGLAKTYLENPVPEGNSNQIIIQEFVKGEEFGMDVINDLHNNYVATYVKKKLGMRAGETDGAVTIKYSKAEEIGKRISELLQHISILDVDFILSETSEIYVIDMNPRFGGGYPFTHAAGVNLPSAIVDWLHDLPLNPENFIMKEDYLSVKGISLQTR